MNRPRALRAVAIVLLLLSCLTVGVARAAPEGVTLLSTGDGRVSIEIRTDFRGARALPSGEWLVEDGRHASTGLAPGLLAPRIPLRVALPPGTRPRVDVQILSTEPVTLGGAAADELADSQLGFEFGEPSWLRNQYCLPLSFVPLVRMGSGWAYVREARVTVEMDETAAGLARGRRATGRDPFEALYRDLVVNHEQGTAWRRPPAPRARRGGDYFSSTIAPWIRVATAREAIFEIRGTDLEALGLRLEDVDPVTLRMFTPRQLPLPETAGYDQVPGWMREMPIEVEGGSDGVFDPGDRVIFLGYGPDGWYSTRGTSPPGLEAWAWDPYANENVYWLTWGGDFDGEPARMAHVDGAGVNEPFVDRVRDRMHFESNAQFDARPKDDKARWERYWWRRVRSTADLGQLPPLTVERIDVELPGAVVSDLADVTARFWGGNNPISTMTPTPPDHDLQFFLDGNALFQREWEGLTRQDFSGSGLWLEEPTAGDTHRFEMHMLPHRDTSINRLDVVYLAWIEVGYTRRLEAEGDSLAVFAGGLSGGHSFEIDGISGDDVRVLDATDPEAPFWIDAARVEGEGADRLRFRSQVSENPPTRFLVRSLSDLSRPRLELDAPPPDGYLRERTDPVQMIVITHEDFTGPAELLAEYRRTHLPDRQSGSVAVVTIEDIFDEFSFGRTDVTAIRNFLQMARDRWDGGDPDEAPAYVLFLGDAHYDHRGLAGGEGQDLVPTYSGYHDTTFGQQFDPRFSSDDYFALLDPPGDTELDLFIGRLVARDEREAEVLVQKTLRYDRDTELGPWKNRVTLVADDLCQATSPDGLGWTHNNQTETLSRTVFPESLLRDKVYLVEFGGPECIFTQKPAATGHLVRSMNEGTLVVNYAGHGSETQIADERVFDLEAVPGLTNRDRLFLFLTASCSVGKYDRSSVGLAEALIRHEEGGAAVVFSAASVAGSFGNFLVNQGFFANVFPEGVAGGARPVGEAALKAKVFAGGINQRRFVLHGDPAVRLVAPDLDAAIELTDEDGAPSPGQLRRGGKYRLSGQVRDLQGEPIDFDGDASVMVFDSRILRHPDTDNDADYSLQGAPIFRGRVTVSAGVFETEFQVPSALRTGDRGGAEIFVYFEDGERDGNGVLHDLFVPEETPPPSDDQEGPEITLVLEGDLESVRSGARIQVDLADGSGINITGLVPSRSVVLQIEESGETVWVEDVAASVDFGDDYRQGTAELFLPASLVAGRRYDLVFEASDNRNNRASERLSFFLSGAGEASFGIDRIFNFPNPTEGPCRFFGEISTESDVEIQIFTIGGKRVARIGPQRVTPSQFSDVGLSWDGRDADGDELGNGVYFFKATATAFGGKSASRVERLVVSR